MEPRERAWSIVLTVETDAGRVFVKETAAAMANDAGITAVLAPLAPELMLTPLAVDPDLRRMILPDGGRLLREELARGPDASHWQRLLPRYAELQRRATADVGEHQLLDAGALPRQPLALVSLLDELLADPVTRGEAGQAGLSADELRVLERLRPTVAAAAEELRSIGPDVSIQHDDLHDGNVLLHAPGGYRIVDWGDAQVGHPFATLLVTLRSAAVRFEVADDDPLIDRLRDAYLEPWTGRLTRPQLQRAVGLATWLGMIGRSLAWRAAYATSNADERADCADGVVGWLQDVAALVPDGAAFRG